MNNNTIFTKTAKGLGEALGKTRQLSREQRKILKEIDGKRSFVELHEQLGMDGLKLRKAIEQMLDGDYIREFGMATPSGGATKSSTSSMGDTEFGLTMPATLEAANSQLTIGDFFRAMEQPEAEEAVTGGSLDFKSIAQAAAPAARNARPEGAQTEEARRASEEETRRITALAQKRVAEQARKEAEDKTRLREQQEAKQRAEEEARRKAEEEARRKAEEEARRKAEEVARRQAEEKARQEAEARARAEAERQAKLRAEEEARRKAEEQARREAEARAREEAERQAQLRAEEEARRKAKEEARLAAEEAARLAAEEAARRVAEEAARRQAEEQARQEAERQERLRAEEEARRREEEAARLAAEEKARQEAEEAERQAQLRAEEEARRKAEEEARLAAEEAARLAAEEAARVLAAEKARKKEEEKARKQAEAEARQAAREQARQEAAENARIEAEQKAQRAAEAKARKEAERLAKQEEERLRREAELAARLRAEEDERLVAEKAAAAVAAEDVAQAAGAGMQAGQAAAPAQEMAEDPLSQTYGQLLQSSEYAASSRWRLPHGWQADLKWALRLGVAALVVLMIAAVALVHVFPFNERLARLQRDASEQFGQPVRIGSMNLSLFPSPQWRIGQIVVGENKQITIERINARVGFGALLSDPAQFSEFEVVSPVINDEGMGWLLFGKSGTAWLQAPLRASDVRWRSQHVVVPAFSASIEPGDGGWHKVVLLASGGKARAELQRVDSTWHFEMTAGDLVLPFGGARALDTLNASGTLEPDAASFSRFTAVVMDGTLSGTARLQWRAGWSLSGEAQARQMDPVRLAPSLFQQGIMHAQFRFTMEAAKAEDLFAAPQARGNFSIRDGVLQGIDMAAQVIGQAGSGKTAFGDLGGDFVHTAGRMQLTRMRLAAGLLSASGEASVDSGGKLAGRFNLDLRTESRQASSRGSLGGTLTAPQFQP